MKATTHRKLCNLLAKRYDLSYEVVDSLVSGAFRPSTYKNAINKGSIIRFRGFGSFIPGPRAIAVANIKKREHTIRYQWEKRNKRSGIFQMEETRTTVKCIW